MGIRREMRDASRFGYAWGRLSVRKSRAVAGPVAERLLAADTVAAAVAALEGTPFARPLAALGPGATSLDTQTAVDEVVAEAYRFTHQAGLPAEVQRFFRLRHDFENVRAIVKARTVGVDVHPFVTSLGSVPVDTLVAALSDWPHVSAGLPDYLRKPLQSLGAEAATSGRRSSSAQDEPDAQRALAALDAGVDRAMYSALTAAALETANEYVCALARLEVDLANAKLLLRQSRTAGRAAHRVAPLLPGGSLGQRAVTMLSVETAEDLARQLASRGPLRGADPRKLLSVATLDLELERARARHIILGSRMDVGLEPLVAYVARIESEARLVRQALISIEAGLVPDDVERAAQSPLARSAAAPVAGSDAAGRATHRIAVLGDAASVAVLTAAGAVGYVATDSAGAHRAWGEAAQQGFAVIFVTESIERYLESEIQSTASAPMPAVTVIPGLGSSGGVGAAKLARAVERALGSAVTAGAITGTSDGTEQ